MQVSFRRIASLLALCFIGVTPAADSPRPVELWRGGDDVLTVTFHAAIERAFENSLDFTLVSEGPPGTMRVILTSHVRPRRWLWWTKFDYDVDFTTAHDEHGLRNPMNSHSQRVLGKSQGTCWKGSVGNCAAKVLKDARIAASRLTNTITFNLGAIDTYTKTSANVSDPANPRAFTADEAKGFFSAIVAHEGGHLEGSIPLLGRIGIRNYFQVATERRALFTESAAYQGMRMNDPQSLLWNNSWAVIDREKNRQLGIEQFLRRFGEK
jgi:hypothetical protein